jgi:hypothetical protein
MSRDRQDLGRIQALDIVSARGDQELFSIFKASQTGRCLGRAEHGDWVRVEGQGDHPSRSSGSLATAPNQRGVPPVHTVK